MAFWTDAVGSRGLTHYSLSRVFHSKAFPDPLSASFIDTAVWNAFDEPIYGRKLSWPEPSGLSSFHGKLRDLNHVLLFSKQATDARQYKQYKLTI